MGRDKKSPEERKKVIASFVAATAQIIEEEGMEAASIRKIAARAGYSSATMYLYFDNVNKLLVMATVSYLKEYVNDLSSHSQEASNAEETFYLVWELFCKHSFSNAAVFHQLLYSEHELPLDDIIKEYYATFPDELENISGATLSMLLAGDPLKRNLTILTPYTRELGFSSEETIMLNAIITAYHRDLLYRCKIGSFSDKTPEELTRDFMTSLHFLLRR